MIYINYIYAGYSIISHILNFGLYIKCGRFFCSNIVSIVIRFRTIENYMRTDYLRNIGCACCITSDDCSAIRLNWQIIYWIRSVKAIIWLKIVLARGRVDHGRPWSKKTKKTGRTMVN